MFEYSSTCNIQSSRGVIVSRLENTRDLSAGFEPIVEEILNLISCVINYISMQRDSMHAQN